MSSGSSDTSDTGGTRDDIGADAASVLDFWFGAPGSDTHGTQRTVWFKKDASFDRSIAERFGPSIEQALRGELDGWQATPHGALARILLLDQFTRNVFRGDKRAYAGDTQALAGATALVGTRADETLPPFMRAFAYMPFEHAEGMAMQDEAVRLFKRLAASADGFAENVEYAERHRAVVERFGRFPQRNAALGRASTSEELAFLARPGSRF